MRKVMVFGAGVSGIGAFNLLKKIGIEVILVDDKKGISSKEALKMLDGIDLFVKSPGIPYVELVKVAIDKGIEVIDELELAYRELKKINEKTSIIAVTGTNGKTTVTSKIKEMLEFGEKTSRYAGNIGVSFSEVVCEIMDGVEIEYIVLEMSSYQLENLKYFKADIAMILNLAPDHLDRYNGDIEEYYKAKLNIGMNQDSKDLFIINQDSKDILKRIEIGEVRTTKISLKENSGNTKITRQGNMIISNGMDYIEVDKLSLKGEHNLENMLFLIAVAEELKIDKKKVKKFLSETKSLEHRMEEFLTVGKLEFVNDSKGTNIESTEKAVKSYENPILICGGVDKKLDLNPLVDLIIENVKEVYLIGETANKLNELLLEKKYSENRIFNMGILEDAIIKIKTRVEESKKDIILLSPATSSFDQYKSYIVRGQEFKRLIKKHFEKGEKS